MWRSFFFAIGTMLIILGIQCIVVEKFSVSTDSSLVKIGKRIVNSGKNALIDNGERSDLPTGQIPAEAVEMRGFGGRPSQNSLYGSSRIAEDRFGNNQFFNAIPASSNPNSNANSAFRLPGRINSSVVPPFGSPNGLPAKLQVFQTEDWMPWSMIAAGAIVLLYTRSWQSQRSTD